MNRFTIEPDEEARIFHEGVRLFNEGEWFDAHEVWEDIWHIASGPKKAFYQGLIQCAVTFEHVRRGNPRGVRSVFASATPKFDGLPEIYMGLNVPAFLDAMRQAVKPVLDLPAEAFDPAAPRGQDLPFDFENAPTITLAYDPFA